MDNYPLGAANDPRAPYNQPDSEPIDTDVIVLYSMSKSLTIPVSNYNIIHDEDVDYDEDGRAFVVGGTYTDYDDTNLLQEFKDSGELGIPQLLEYLKTYITEDLANLPEHSGKGKHLKHLLEACDAWTVDEEEVILDN